MQVIVFLGENHLIIHDKGAGRSRHLHIAFTKKKKKNFHNLKLSIVLCE